MQEWLFSSLFQNRDFIPEFESNTRCVSWSKHFKLSFGREVTLNLYTLNVSSCWDYKVKSCLTRLRECIFHSKWGTHFKQDIQMFNDREETGNPSLESRSSLLYSSKFECLFIRILKIVGLGYTLWFVFIDDVSSHNSSQTCMTMRDTKRLCIFFKKFCWRDRNLRTGNRNIRQHFAK